MSYYDAVISLFSERPELLCAPIFLFQVILGMVTAFFLAFRLNPKFDPLLKKSLEDLEYVPNLTTYFMRTGIYVTYVVDKRFGVNRPEVQAIDFRKGLSKATIFWCYVSFINGFIVLFGWFVGLGGYSIVRSFF